MIYRESAELRVASYGESNYHESRVKIVVDLEQAIGSNIEAIPLASGDHCEYRENSCRAKR